MNCKPTILLLLLMTLCAATSCQDEGVAPPDSSITKGIVGDPASSRALQQYLGDLWARSDLAGYFRMEQQIEIEDGGVLIGVPTFWSPRCSFRVDVPPNAVSGDVIMGTTFTIALEVPQNFTMDPDGNPVPAVFKLEPDGLEFCEPVTVTLCYPDWLTPNRLYKKFCLVPPTDGDKLFSFTDYEEIVADGPLDVGITFTTMHFSRWVLENGKEDGPMDLLP